MRATLAIAPKRLGAYELVERLGSGGMAEVFLARRAGPHGFAKRFAVKRILPHLADEPRFVSMFCDEARIGATLTHPNIVQVVDFGEQDGQLYMAMEYVDGVSCAKLLRFVAERGERFPIGAALYITHELLRALDFVHSVRDDQGRAQQLVHRDVSPGNILLGRAGDVKLADFGILQSTYVDRRTEPGQLKGKLGYMAPEQALGALVDSRSDLFALGIVLAEMLTARPLFPGQTELEILMRIRDVDLSVLDHHGRYLPAALQAFLRRTLQRRSTMRFQLASEMADELRHVARVLGISLTEGRLLPWLVSLDVLPAQSGLRAAVRPSDPTEVLRAVDALEARHSRPPGA